MKTLETLLRVRRDQMNEQKKLLLQAQKQSQEIFFRIETATERINTEKNYTDAHPKIASDFTIWVESARAELNLLKDRLEHAKKDETSQRQKLEKAWQETKKAENALNFYEERETKKRQQQENKEMDEIAERLYRFNRSRLKQRRG